MVESLLGLPESMEFAVEVSLNGVTFSDDGCMFKFIENNQLLSTDISVGPDSGGTVIHVSVMDFPLVNENPQQARCIFPGYEEANPSRGIVEARFLSAELIECIAPPLKVSQAAIDAGLMFDSIMASTVKVKVELLDVDQEMIFRYTYMKDTRVTFFEPPNMFYDVG